MLLQSFLWLTIGTVLADAGCLPYYEKEPMSFFRWLQIAFPSSTPNFDDAMMEKSDEYLHNSWTSILLNNEADVKKIQEKCLSKLEKKNILGEVFQTEMFIEAMVDTIGLNELRSMFEFKPLPAWKAHDGRKSSEAEQKAAKQQSIETYYDLMEPTSRARSLSHLSFQKYSEIDMKL